LAIEVFYIKIAFNPNIKGVHFMEELVKKRPLMKKDYLFRRTEPKLWCGRVQGLCDGSLCSACHLFPEKDLSSNSILSRPTMTDHGSIGLIREEEE
jgi:hypothetical protein